MERLEKLIRKCDKCKLHECIGCEICWKEVQEIKRLKHEKEMYKHIYTELRKQWNRVVDEILGKNYYNYGCDHYSCDKFTADDIIYKYKKNRKRWWEFWK